MHGLGCRGVPEDHTIHSTMKLCKWKKKNERWILLEYDKSDDNPSVFQVVKIFTNIDFFSSEAMIFAAMNAILATS